VNVWQRFSIRTLGVYSDLYLKTDVLLLAENFHNCVASYCLDPTHYYTLPGFTWDAETYAYRIQVASSGDIDLVIERGVRGGLSQCSDRYAQANNKYMRSIYLSKSSYLMYYEQSVRMCDVSIFAEFQWVEDAANYTDRFSRTKKYPTRWKQWYINNRIHWNSFRAKMYVVRIDGKKDIKKAKVERIML